MDADIMAREGRKEEQLQLEAARTVEWLLGFMWFEIEDGSAEERVLYALYSAQELRVVRLEAQS
ncbi:hypothetical protein [Variovorax sp. tm]|uniref:hypothetical protein n=1 Tax=Variovorax atrisoli TaxID=3394203 RepID=UPI003A7FBAC7